MAFQSPLGLIALATLLCASPGAMAAEPSHSETSDCALGSGGADATGNDCGSVARTEDHSRFHPRPRPAARSVAPAASAKLPPAPPAARPAVNWPEGQTACAGVTGGADPTGNDCNGQLDSTPVLTARVRH